MYYVEPVYRPPSEAYSLLVQASVGCLSASQGHCYYCGSWLIDREIPQKKFRIRPGREILRDLDQARVQMGSGVRKIFLLDSNAMVIPAAALERICRHAYGIFPGLERVSVYACAEDIQRKSDADLRRVREAGISLLYVGLESGSETVLQLINKGVTAEQTVRACQRAQASGFDLSLTVILGLGGTRLSGEHAEATGEVLSRIQPRYVGALTLMVVPGTPVETWIREGSFQMLSQEEILLELRRMLEHIGVQREMVFRTNHASNYLPLSGTLPGDKGRLLRLLNRALDRKVPLRPEHLRGL
jgi:radical SAM superfamily enzyme YgiQ (UPF0313 family)